VIARSDLAMKGALADRERQHAIATLLEAIASRLSGVQSASWMRRVGIAA
jgi:hypothetical protein